MVAEIGWAHNILIFEKCKDDLEREFYIRMTRKYGWTKNVLALRIDNRDYEKTLLNQTNFENANLNQANLNASYASGANFKDAFLIKTQFENAFLIKTNFFNAYLMEANLQNSYLMGADFENASLYKADFRGAKGLTIEQLVKAKTLYLAKFDAELQEQVKALMPEWVEA